MPKQSVIAPRKTSSGWRVIIPRDLRQGEKRETKWFRSKTNALSFCAELMARREGAGRRLYNLSQLEQQQLVESVKIAGDAAAVLDAVRFWRQQKPQETATTKELAVRAVAAKEKAGKTAYYCACLRRSLQLFLSHREVERARLGLTEAELAHEIQPHHIEQWIHSDPRWSAFTKQTYLRDVRTMFSFGVKHKLCVSNPALAVERPSLADTSPGILSVEDCRRLMQAAERVDPALVQYLALCLFAGLRPSEAMRLRAENVKPDHLEVFGKKVRARNRRLVPINPTLRAWLDRYPGDFGPANLTKRLKAVRNATAVGGRGPVPPIHWTQDCLRHTFVSHHYALHGAKETANVAGHSEHVLFQHYRELVTRSDAELFWGIKPKEKRR